MGKSFRCGELNQALLLPSSLRDWLSEKLNAARRVGQPCCLVPTTSEYGAAIRREDH